MSKHPYKGFNLIEVLVALVILSIGLLGIAGLQLTGVRATQGSYYRSQATAFMNDMAERMYVNRPGVAAGNYSAIDSNSITCGSATPTAQCGLEVGGAAVVNCNAANMANYDTVVMACGYKKSGSVREGGVQNVLPNGRLQVACIPTAGVCGSASQHTITVSWSERGDKDAQGENQLVTETISMRVQP